MGSGMCKHCVVSDSRRSMACRGLLSRTALSFRQRRREAATGKRNHRRRLAAARASSWGCAGGHRFGAVELRLSDCKTGAARRVALSGAAAGVHAKRTRISGKPRVFPGHKLGARPRPGENLQLSDIKHIIALGPKLFPTNLPTWTDWRSAGESELARARVPERAAVASKYVFPHPAHAPARTFPGRQVALPMLPFRPRN